MDTDPFVRDLFHTIPRKPFSMDLTFRKFLNADVNQQYIFQKHYDLDFLSNVKKVSKKETKEYLSNNLEAGDNVKICTYNVDEKPFVRASDSLPVPVPRLSIRDFVEELLSRYGPEANSDASSSAHVAPAAPAAPPTKAPSRNKQEYKSWLEGITETLLVNKQVEQHQKYMENEVSKKNRRKEKENVKDKGKEKVYHKVIEKNENRENTAKILASGKQRTELLLERKEAKEKERGMIGIALKKHGQMNIENERQYRDYVKSLEIKGMRTKLGNHAFKKWMRHKKKHSKPEIVECSKKSSVCEIENVDQKPIKSRKRPTLQYILKRIEMGKKGYI